MSPFNLEDVERYLVDRATEADYFPPDAPQPGTLIQWLRNRFTELRAREQAVLRQ